SHQNNENPKQDSSEISYYTSDSVRIFGDLYEVNKNAASVLLFHQGGSNSRAEYKAIIPELNQQGFNVLTIDQRTGGQLYGAYNRTVAEFALNRYGYCDAYPDLEGALDYLINVGFSGNKILWGSSYSAALVIQLAHKRQDDVTAVLAFSPASGDPMEGCQPEEYFSDLQAPLLVLRPASEMEYDHVKQQFELAQETGHETYIADPGVHGSSMLVSERIKGDAAQNWGVVNSFLSKFK
ncbi:MAG: alpha/beta hydrolase, partial [Cyclobacteriaceae bacterium]